MGQAQCCAVEPDRADEVFMRHQTVSAAYRPRSWDAAPPPPQGWRSPCCAVEPERTDELSMRNQSVPEYFPMHTVSIHDFQDLHLLESFEELHARGAVHPAEYEAVIHFISHEWLGCRHPDPEAVQLRRMQQVFNDIIRGSATELFTPADWTAFTQRVSAGSKGAYRKLEGACNVDIAGGTLTEDDFRAHVALGDVWIDYGSIPQLPEDPRKLDAISSIPAYLDRCQYFWVLAPPARHLEKGTWCSFATWRSRGWCRLEEWGNFLKAQPCAPLIITHSQKLTTIGWADFMLASQGKPYLAPCAGAFSCCSMGHELVLPSGKKQKVPCDKTFVTPVLQKLFEAKRDQLRVGGNFWHGMFLTKVGPMIFGGAPEDLMLQEDAGREKESVEAFLHRFGVASVADSPAPGFSIWAYAAAVNHLPMLRKLQQEPEALAKLGDDTHDMVLVQAAAEQGHVAVLEFLLKENLVEVRAINIPSPSLCISALDRAAKGGFPSMVSFLLDHQADIAYRRKDGSTALHGAAMSGHASCCQVLLERRADVGALTLAGKAPLHLAAHPVTLYGNAEGKLPTLQVLMEFKADPLFLDGEGKSAIEIARESAFMEAESILQAVADTEKAP